MKPDLHPTHRLYLASGGEPFPEGESVCVLCGETCEPGRATPIGQVIRDTFTNHGMCRAQHSREVCPACTHYFNHRWSVPGGKKPWEYRLCSLRVVGDSWASWQRASMRADIEGWLQDGLPGSGVLVVALSKKKHLLPMASVHPAGVRAFSLMLEEERVRVCARDWIPLAHAFDGLLHLGCGKGEILSGDYSSHTLRRLDLLALRKLDRVIGPWRGSGLLTLVSYTTLLESDDADRDGADTDD